MSMDVNNISKLPIAAVITETLKKIKGMKLAFLGAILASILTLIVAGLLFPILPHPEAPDANLSTQPPAMETVVANTSIASTNSPTTTVSAVPSPGDNHPDYNAYQKQQMHKILEHPGFLVFSLCIGLIIYYLFFLVITCLCRLGVYRGFGLPLSFKSYFAPYLNISLVITVFLYHMFLYMTLFIPLILLFLPIMAFTIITPPQPLLAFVSILLLSLPAIFIFVRLELGLPVILIKECDVFSAMGESWQSTRHYFWRLSLFNVINFLLILVPLLPLALLKKFYSWEMATLAVLGVVILFWTIPYIFINYGVIYKRLRA